MEILYFILGYYICTVIYRKAIINDIYDCSVDKEERFEQVHGKRYKLTHWTRWIPIF